MPQLRLSQIILSEKKRPEWAEIKEGWVKEEKESIKKRYNNLYDIDGTKVM